MTISEAAKEVVLESADETGISPSEFTIWAGDHDLCHRIADRSGMRERREKRTHPLDFIAGVLDALDRDRGTWDKGYINAHTGHSSGGLRKCKYRAFTLRRKE